MSTTGAKTTILLLDTGDRTFEIELGENNAVRSLIENLPQKISMSRWGDEFYGSLKAKIAYSGDPLRDVFEIGEVALWPSGNAFCIFFGPTPVSVKDEPRAASPCVPLGKIKGDPTVFRKYGLSLKGVTLSAG